MSISFPRKYLLDIYNKAIDEGFLHIHPISQADAVSLRQSLYRLRRRSDAANARFILPEFHLVTVGQWSPDKGGCLPIMYDKLPEGHALPTIEAVAAETFSLKTPIHPEGHIPVSQMKADLAEQQRLAAEAEQVQLSPQDISSFVSRLRKRVADSSEEPDDDQ